jgi:hypothetical protein
MSCCRVATNVAHLPGDARQHDDRADLRQRHEGRRGGDNRQEHLVRIVHNPSPEGLPSGWLPPRACS